MVGGQRAISPVGHNTGALCGLKIARLVGGLPLPLLALGSSDLPVDRGLATGRACTAAADHGFAPVQLGCALGQTGTRASESFQCALLGGFSQNPERTSELVGLQLLFRGLYIPLISARLPLVSKALALVRDAFTLVRDAFTLVSDAFTEVASLCVVGLLPPSLHLTRMLAEVEAVTHQRPYAAWHGEDGRRS